MSGARRAMFGATEARIHWEQHKPAKTMFEPSPGQKRERERERTFVQADCPPHALRRRGKMQRLTARRKLHCLHGGCRCRRRLAPRYKKFQVMRLSAFFGPSLHGENIWVASDVHALGSQSACTNAISLWQGVDGSNILFSGFWCSL